MAFWYGIDAFRLSQPQLAAYHFQLRRVRAQKKIQEGDLEGLHWRSVRQLYYDATGDMCLADRAAASYLESQIREATERAAQAAWRR